MDKQLLNITSNKKKNLTLNFNATIPKNTIKINYIIVFEWQFIKFVQGYMTEVRWLKNNYQPTLEEYLRLAIESGGYVLMTTTSYIGMSDSVTEDIFKWVSNEPKILNTATVLARIMDDIASNEVYIQNPKEYFLELYLF